MHRAINIAFLSQVSQVHLGNANEVQEPKTLPDGKPYLSGQTVRRAIENAIFMDKPEWQKGTSEVPNRDIKADLYSDLMGYLIPGMGEKRYSPLKATPLIGHAVIQGLSDNQVRFSEFEKEKEDGKSTIDTRMMIKQLHYDTLYSGHLFVDMYRIGRSQTVNLSKELTEKKAKGNLKAEDVGIGNYQRKDIDHIGDEERKKRTGYVLDALLAMDSGFANQARNAFSIYPEMLLIASQPQYNHLLAKAIVFEEKPMTKVAPVVCMKNV